MLPLSTADLDEAAAMLGDPRVMRYVDGGTRDRANTTRALEANERCWAANGWGLWAIRDVTSGAFVGQAGLQPVTEIHGATAEFSIIVSRRSWGTGVATEAGHAIVFDAWQRYSGSEIHAVVHPDDPASGPLLRKLGFRLQDEGLIGGEMVQVWHIQRLG